MKWKELRNKPWVRFISNKYVLLSLIFAGWMFFLDSNSWFVHHELNQEVNELKENKEYYQNQIAHDKAIIQQLQDSVQLEQFARQKYYMKRADEDIYIIEYDSIE
ncbi:septum formation initiator family protein [Zunongwangia sp. F260]|uniref:Septum formation initiator family protein n=2 Tax=Autumnicola TaxID=3160927 RepID=A0ABU3CYA6_9FLAO|nr:MULTISPECIES: septum formation initiator family protein [unclassified Zunongwangia]MDT0645178.1 septum formation initiator family protein [Zunongwangia sp. F260]MDT0651337.1 septum formation initiator family protein [Zunongwangia sp. F297]